MGAVRAGDFLSTDVVAVENRRKLPKEANAKMPSPSMSAYTLATDWKCCPSPVEDASTWRETPQRPPSCCWIPLRTVCVLGVLCTIVGTVTIAGLLIYHVHNVKEPGYKRGEVIALICGVAVLELATCFVFLFGLFRGRHRLLIPFIFSAVCVCVATIGVSIAGAITMPGEISDMVAERDKKGDNSTSTAAQVWEVVGFKLLFILLALLQLVATISYGRMFFHLRRLRRATIHPSDE